MSQPQYLGKILISGHVYPKDSEEKWVTFLNRDLCKYVKWLLNYTCKLSCSDYKTRRKRTAFKE